MNRPQIELGAPDGARKSVPVLGRCGKWAFVWWPGAGAYDLDLNTGLLFAPNAQVPHGWKAAPDELTRIKALRAEAFT